MTKKIATITFYATDCCRGCRLHIPRLMLCAIQRSFVAPSDLYSRPDWCPLKIEEVADGNV